MTRRNLPKRQIDFALHLRYSVTVMTLKDFAELNGLNPSTARVWLSRGKIVKDGETFHLTETLKRQSPKSVSLFVSSETLKREIDEKLQDKVDKVDKYKADCLEAERLLWGKISHLEFMIDELQTQVALFGQPQPEARTQTTAGELTYAPFEDL